MYHELRRPGRPLADLDPGYVRYVVDEPRFVEQLRWIATAGFKGVSLADAHRAGLDMPGRVVITFDDGCETDWVVAAPHLAAHGFGATFYVVSRWVGRRPGFLTVAQLRDLSDAGFEIGSHSATHAFLSDLADAELRRELVDSRRELEDMLGKRVSVFSCPGGRWSRRVADAARDAGYESVATSRVATNGSDADPYALARCAVFRDMSPRHVEALCRGRGLGSQQLWGQALTAAKAVLGNRVYTSLRDAALRRVNTLLT